MGVFDLFSKRQKRLRGDVPDMYQYSLIPQPLRVQIVHIWRDTLGDATQYHSSSWGPSVRRAYGNIVESLRREYGVFCLVDRHGHGRDDYIEELTAFILSEPDAEKVLDAVELSFWTIDNVARSQNYLRKHNASEIADEAIDEINNRFREHGAGFQYTDGEIIRIDSELIHAEVVKPALGLLRGEEYAGAQDEFLRAHEHYRHGSHKEALAEAQGRPGILRGLRAAMGFEIADVGLHDLGEPLILQAVGRGPGAVWRRLGDILRMGRGVPCLKALCQRN
jgi:hypothetical protein